MRKLLSILSIIVFTVMTACSPRFAVTTDRDVSVNLSSYTSFAFDQEDEYLKSYDPILDSRLNRKRIANLIQEEMVSKGYQFSESGSRLKVQFYTKLEDKQEVRNVSNPNPFFFSRWWWWNANNNTTYVRNYEESTLIVNLIDSNTDELIWQGWAIGEINYKSPKYKEQLQEKVNQIFEELPMKTASANYQSMP